MSYILNLFFCRDANDSLLKGVLTQQNYEYGHSRTMVSLKLCFYSCLYELLGTVITVVTPTLYSLGIHHQYYVDAIMMFLVIPFLHLMNDEITKAVIVEQGWYQGVKYMAGYHDQAAPQNTPGRRKN